MRLSFSRAARREAEATVRWYQAREDGLGLALITEIERAARLIAEAPKAWPLHPSDHRARRIPLSRFPYSIVYFMRSDDEVIVVALAHGRRKPGYWQKRLG